MINLRTALFAPMMLVAAVLAGQQHVEAIVETKRFHEPEQGELVDINISILGSSVIWVADERGFRGAQVEMLALIERGDEIVNYTKELIHSPDLADTLQHDFTHQSRFLLEPGEYHVEVELRDVNRADEGAAVYDMPLVVPAREKTTLSDIIFLEENDQAGTLPYPGNYFPPEVEKLRSYCEVYGTTEQFGEQGDLMIVNQIETYETGQVAGQYRRVHRAKAASVLPSAVEFDIHMLPTGNYLMATEIRDRNNQLVNRRTQFFQRYNDAKIDIREVTTAALGANFTDAYTDTDTLAEYIASMRPIADELERKMIDDRAKDKRADLMRQLMYTFWYNRNPTDPKGAWEKYLEAVNYANSKFGCRNMRGYQSDQGYVFLRYGAPNTVVDRSNETTALPYMIWHYYQAGRYTDRRFVFYQPERSTTCWTLITSDMPGELNDSRWLQQIVPGMADGGIKRNEVLDNYNNPK